MPYTINKTTGDQVAVVADGTVDSTLDIKLIGKNYAGYGEIQNENFVHLLENFANNSAPPKPIKGQIWYDSNVSKLKFYDKNNKWRTTGGAEVNDIEPTGLTTGDFWFNTATNQLFAYDAEHLKYVLVGPQAAGSNQTELFSRLITDTLGNEIPIIEARLNSITTFVISSNPLAFTPANTPTNAIPGFAKIRPGITLAYTEGEGNDPESGYGITQEAFRFFGTATNSEKLGGLSASDFVLASGGEFTQKAHFSDEGFTVGLPTYRLDVSVNGSGVPVISTVGSGDTILFQTKPGGAPRVPLKLVGTNIQNDGGNFTYNIGTNTARYSTVYAQTFDGAATQADGLTLGLSVVYPSTGNSPNTVALRDGNGDISAVEFRGIATSANYADLAEKYLADAEYEVGTVVCVGGEKEVTACSHGKRALGAVSANPAFKMNEGLEGGTYIALKGRVPVKVVGFVKKGDELIASADGCAVASISHSNGVFAIALETSDSTGVKLIEAVIL